MQGLSFHLVRLVSLSRVLMHHGGVPALPVSLRAEGKEMACGAYEMMPPTASTIPTRLASLIDLPLCIQPSTMIEQVLQWPTTVLLTGPASLTMTNCVKLIKQARRPLCR